MVRHRFGGRAGHLALVEELAALQVAGVDHVSLHLRRNSRPLDDTLYELAEHVLPRFHSDHHSHHSHRRTA